MLAGKQARTQGGRIMIAAMRPLVAEIFSRFTMLFEIYPGVREALTAASPRRWPLSTAGSAPMRVRFWGTRGSLPVALTWRDVRDRLARALVAANGQGLDMEKAHAFAEQHLWLFATHTFGGHSSCVELLPPDAAPDEYFVCDMGSGARPFGEHIAAPAPGHHLRLHVPHALGPPHGLFFGPAYVRGNNIRIHGCHEALEHAFRRQQDPPSFPVPSRSSRRTSSSSTSSPDRRTSCPPSR